MNNTDQVVIAEIRKVINQMTDAQQVTCLQFAQTMRAFIKEHSLEGCLAVALVGAELQAENPIA